jgi:hypothetical protein
MKTLFFPLISLVLLITASCSESVTETVTYKINEPVFMSRDAFRSSVKVSSTPHEITGYGKISYYQGYLYMSEPGKGIHIINNTNPAAPKVAGYIELLGNADISVRNNVLYADSYVDLVWFDVSVPSSPVLKGRLQNVFPEAMPMMRNGVGFDWDMCYGEKKQDGVIVGWKEVERTEDIDDYRGGWFWRWGWMEGDVLATSKDMASNGSSNGVNGSMSRFTIYLDYLYTVINNQMTIFNLGKENPEVAADSIYIGWNVETIFSNKNNMFFGTPTGMLIYSVENPLKPVFKSSIQHVFGCDPVVVEDDIAYVTVHSGVNCRTGTTVNDLIIIDVKDVTKPKQIASYAMTEPKGLGIDNKKLFICDDGLKIFKADDPMTIMANKLAHYKGMAGYDLIPFNNVLMMIAEEGIYQYDYSNVNNIRELSFLPVKKAN